MEGKKMGRPTGRNVVQVPITLPRQIVDALRDIRLKTGTPISHTISTVMESWYQSVKKPTAVKF